MISRTFDILLQAEKNFPEIPAFSIKRAGVWQIITYADYAHNAKKLAKGLIASGVKKSDKIATFSNNCPEWNIIDMAVTMTGAIHVPVFPAYNENDTYYILEHTDISKVFVFNKLIYNVISKITAKIEKINELILIDDSDELNCLKNLYQKAKETSDDVLLQRMEDVKYNDLASIYFTSGTGGNPKGACVLHRNIIEVIKSMSERYGLKSGHKVLSYLPLSHSFESAHSYLYQLSGASVFYAENVASVEANLAEVKPYMFLSVPLLLEKIYMSVRSAIEKADDKVEAEEALSFALRFEPDNNLPEYRKRYEYFSAKNYKYWKEKYCGNVKRIYAGGAALPEYLARFYFALDILIFEMYGLTETFAVAVNSLQYGYKIGTVGVPDKNVEIRLAEDGEIICRSPYIVNGYYKDQENTRQAFDDKGFFHTGDLAEWVDGKFLKITGRKKDVFKVASGNFVSPENIEKQLKQSPYISHALVFGKDREYLSALIVPDFDVLKNICDEKGYMADDWQQVLEKEGIKELFQQAVDSYNRNVWGPEQILKFEVITNKWTVQGGELTPTMKLKRQLLLTKYADLIQKFYNH